MELNTITLVIVVRAALLSKHLKVLEDANSFQLIEKTEFARHRTWLSLSPNGKKSFKLHLQEPKKNYWISI